AGDSDLNYKVDGIDLATLGLNWSPAGTTRRWAEGDTDGDGDVDGVDLAALGLNWVPGGYGSEGLGAGPLLTSTAPTSEASDEPLPTAEVDADESQPMAPLDMDVVAIAPRMAPGTGAAMPAVKPIDLTAFGGTSQPAGRGLLSTSDDATVDVVSAAGTDVDKSLAGNALRDGLVDVLAAAEPGAV
ncbi:MAG: hypothetical protein QF662_07330, partial [Phycisphaerae bacterium]|nr:hypothetical protein [Phycisphaerae bacterium]